MEESTTGSFLDLWHTIMLYGAIFFGLLAVGVYLYHKIRVSSIRSLKEKYDYKWKNEIKIYKICYIFLAIGAAMLINTYGKGSLTFHPVWFFVRIFISISGATLIGYVAALILEYYYPTKLNAQLRKLRYTPRINPNNGNKMVLLPEDEEDVHLDEGMQAEENVFSVDYDVWIDESTGYTQIEKYHGHLEAFQCRNCGFYTMKVVREEIIEPPTPTKDGELIKHYECQYCGSVRDTQFHIKRDKNPEEYAHMKKNSSVQKVMLQVYDLSGLKKNYEFHSIEQTRKFLEELENGA